jgi:hypothetical protein
MKYNRWILLYRNEVIIIWIPNIRINSITNAMKLKIVRSNRTMSRHFPWICFWNLQRVAKIVWNRQEIQLSNMLEESALWQGLSKTHVLTVVALSQCAIALPIWCAPNSRLWMVNTTRPFGRPLWTYCCLYNQATGALDQSWQCMISC